MAGMKDTATINNAEVKLFSTYMGPWEFEVEAEWMPRDEEDPGGATIYLDQCQSHMVALDRAAEYLRDMVPVRGGTF